MVFAHLMIWRQCQSVLSPLLMLFASFCLVLVAPAPVRPLLSLPARSTTHKFESLLSSRTSLICTDPAPFPASSMPCSDTKPSVLSASWSSRPRRLSCVTGKAASEQRQGVHELRTQTPPLPMTQPIMRQTIQPGWIEQPLRSSFPRLEVARRGRTYGSRPVRQPSVSSPPLPVSSNRKGPDARHAPRHPRGDTHHAHAVRPGGVLVELR